MPSGTPILFLMYFPISLLSKVEWIAFRPCCATEQSIDLPSSVIRENVSVSGGKNPSFLESSFKLKYAWLGSLPWSGRCPQFSPDFWGTSPVLFDKKLILTRVSGISQAKSPGKTLPCSKCPEAVDEYLYVSGMHAYYIFKF